MTGGLPLVFTHGERAVAHVVDPATPAGEIPGLLALYLGTPAARSTALVWRAPHGETALDPGVAIGHQVAPEAEIDLRAG